MATKEATSHLEEALNRWEQQTLQPTLARLPERAAEFTTTSLRPIKRLYTPLDIQHLDFERDIGFPGEYPFTRGIHPTMYRGKLWTVRQFAGFGTAFDTNKRFKYLLEQGQTGLSVAFDLPTLMGLDSDHPLSEGEVGKCGVAISSLEDMEVLFEGIPLEEVTTSMTINAPAAVIFAMYLVVAEKQGADWKKISGTIQNDILKEYIAQKEWIYPPEPSMRLIVDTIAFCTQEVPRWHPISISGYHIREAGATALQELAFTLRNGIEYVEWCVRAGLDVDAFAPRLSFFFNCHNDFFEEIAKFRAARKVWARVMRERFGARDPRSWMCRFHTQTAGCSLTAQQPYNNIVRTTIQALAAVLGGTQSLHTNALDEALALPTEFAAMLAVRTQQIIAHESGVVNTVDPLGGSYFVEALTSEMERGCYEYFEKIDAMGGMIAAIERGFPQKEIQEAAYRYQQAVDRREKIIVGVNEYVLEKEPIEVPILYIDESVAEIQRERLRRLRARRDNARVQRTLEALKEAARGTENTMPYILECVRAYATLGEICDALKEVFGEYQEPPF
ncbi:MAG: methylmalonyl-CoA mutase family protein [Blastocatellia bacterium]|nr:methylmalonyl-CoA mutase family protein [Blastocatellia bacterium]MCS7156498.1 methylmalonyl-CoA mutase family protein [Blastocatellia bacterium]MCX7751761.1 methylmalonyl-CoA mutase family protein [Blastocatellia bacterium]MDW8168863.1 methylmalonyl-CoA mutase family protein [Acidobacteriota bacterium]MDW8256623.1 methylmalonyl-CoA mutase family protein [Acidobacteriota bacterium]